jgi:uncharacterized linocin/CFP29 family protein
MFNIFKNFISDRVLTDEQTIKLKNIPYTPRHKSTNIYVAADGNFDQQLLQDILVYSNNRKNYGNHTLVIENNITKLKLNDN